MVRTSVRGIASQELCPSTRRATMLRVAKTTTTAQQKQKFFNIIIPFQLVLKLKT